MAAKANPIPVFPEVPSMMVPPGFRRPSFSASSIFLVPFCLFTEFPGLKVSTLLKPMQENLLPKLYLALPVAYFLSFLKYFFM